MSKVTIDYQVPSEYIEKDSYLRKLKRRLTYKFAFKLLSRYKQKNGYVSALEIGIGSGYFMEFFKETYPECDIDGLEYDVRLIEHVNKRLSGLNLISGNAENFDLDKTYDVICSFQVIEHLFNPDQMLKHVHKHLKPDGILIITSPNQGGLGSKILKEKWEGYRSDHVSLKSCAEWSDLIRKNGFEELYMGSTFFSGLPFMRKLPFGLINWILLVILGSCRWSYGESFVGVYINKQDKGMHRNV